LLADQPEHCLPRHHHGSVTGLRQPPGGDGGAITGGTADVDRARPVKGCRDGLDQVGHVAVDRSLQVSGRSLARRSHIEDLDGIRQRFAIEGRLGRDRSSLLDPLGHAADESLHIVESDPG